MYMHLNLLAVTRGVDKCDTSLHIFIISWAIFAEFRQRFALNMAELSQDTVPSLRECVRKQGLV